MKSKRTLKIASLVGLLSFLFAGSALAAPGTLDPNQFAHHVIGELGHLASILQILSIAGGLCLFVAAMFELKRYGEMRTMMSHQMTIAKPLAMLLAAIMLLTLPLMIGTFMLAFWGNSSPMSYTPTSDSGWAPLVPVIIMFVRIVGVFAFMRGIFMLSRSGGQGGQPGQLSKAVLHMFGGVLCVNVVATSHLMHTILPI